MGERSARPHRVLIEDARRNGHHLRATWHPGRRQFVLSTWRADTCTGAAQLAVEDVTELATLLVDGLAEAATRPAKAAPGVPTSKPGLAGLIDRVRWLVRGTVPGAPPAGPGSPPATVHPLRHRSA